MKTVSFIFAVMISVTAVAQNWETSYDDALVLSAKTDRILVVVFAGSDWCVPCIKLDKEIWTSDHFKSYSEENYVLYRADFPRKKKNQLPAEQADMNSKLADKFNPNGHFPLVVLVDSHEQVLGTTSYNKMSPTDYVSHLNSFIK